MNYIHCEKIRIRPPSKRIQTWNYPTTAAHPWIKVVFIDSIVDIHNCILELLFTAYQGKGGKTFSWLDTAIEEDGRNREGKLEFHFDPKLFDRCQRT